jgi:hypothetical protein
MSLCIESCTGSETGVREAKRVFQFPVLAQGQGSGRQSAYFKFLYWLGDRGSGRQSAYFTFLYWLEDRGQGGLAPHKLSTDAGRHQTIIDRRLYILVLVAAVYLISIYFANVRYTNPHYTSD